MMHPMVTAKAAVVLDPQNSGPHWQHTSLATSNALLLKACLAETSSIPLRILSLRSQHTFLWLERLVHPLQKGQSVSLASVLKTVKNTRTKLGIVNNDVKTTSLLCMQFTMYAVAVPSFPAYAWNSCPCNHVWQLRQALHVTQVKYQCGHSIFAAKTQCNNSFSLILGYSTSQPECYNCSAK